MKFFQEKLKIFDFSNFHAIFMLFSYINTTSYVYLILVLKSSIFSSLPLPYPSIIFIILSSKHNGFLHLQLFYKIIKYCNKKGSHSFIWTSSPNYLVIISFTVLSIFYFSKCHEFLQSIITHRLYILKLVINTKLFIFFTTHIMVAQKLYFFNSIDPVNKFI